jgi:hypothetical protein
MQVLADGEAVMNQPNLAKRIDDLEREVARLREKVDGEQTPDWRQWLDKIYGAFENDPLFDEAMTLGREYRESLSWEEESNPRTTKAPKKRQKKKK